MVNVTAQVDHESMARLSASIAAYMDYMRKTPMQAVTYAGLKIAESGRSIMSKAKAARGTKRDIIDNPAYRENKLVFRWARAQKRRGQPIPAETEQALAQFTDAPYFILWRTQRKMLRIPSWDKQDPRRTILKVGQRGPSGKPGYGGLGRTTWNVIAGKMGAGAQGETGGAGRYIFVSTQALTGAVQTRIINKLSYQEEAFPGITAQAIARGSKALENRVQERIKQAKEKARL